MRIYFLIITFATFNAMAQAQDPMLLHSSENRQVRAHFQAGINAVSEQNLFWKFADTVAADSGFESDADWLETYIKPGISFEQTLENNRRLYGKASMVASHTLGIDAYDTGDTGRTTLEEAYLGYKTPIADTLTLDLSAGPRELKLGTGMLIANGATSGFERGALKLGPRKAWEMSLLSSLYSDSHKGTVFVIDPNELDSNDGNNRLAGVDVRTDNNEDEYLGITFLHVLKSDSAYPQAAPGGIGPPTIDAGAREGLSAINFYTKAFPFENSPRNTFFTVDVAYEWNEDIDMKAWGGRIQAGHSFQNHPWSPTLTYAFQSFSGDDPDTSDLERFDPLYYEGSPSAWSTGSKSSMVFINSNVMSHSLALKISPTQRDTITFRYSMIRANELDSPIQFGQATRVDFSNDVPTVISGVKNAELSDDFFIEYTRIINPNTYLTAGFSIAEPGEGISDVVSGRVSTWTGGFINVVVNY